MRIFMSWNEFVTGTKFHSAGFVSIYKEDMTFHLNKFFAEVDAERLKSGFPNYSQLVLFFLPWSHANTWK